MKSLRALRPTSRLALLIGLVAMIAAGAVAFAADPQPAIKTTTPTSERQITNIDVLRQQIRTYYGDPLGTGTFAPDSNYAKEAEDAASDGTRYLDGLARQGHANHAPAMAAIVLDVDDTTLATWNYEIASNWAFNPTTNANFVLGELFPPVPGMVGMVQRAASQGYAIFFLTGRPTSQETATLGNLTDSDTVGLNAGYPHPTQLVNGEGSKAVGVFAVSGVTAGLAAFLGGSFYGSVSSGDAQGYELYVIASAVVGGASLLGGRGSALGAMLGALLIVLIRQSIRTLHFDQNYEWIVIGCAIVIAVVVDQWSTRLNARRLSRAAERARAAA